MTNTITNKQIAECFKKAKAYLIGPNLDNKNGNKHTYICYAIKQTNHFAVIHALHIISSRLEGRTTLKVWLHDKHEIPLDDLTFTSLQKHRHAWLDLLIKEFESK